VLALHVMAAVWGGVSLPLHRLTLCVHGGRYLFGHHMFPRGLRRRCLCPVSVCCAHHCQLGGGGYGGPGVSRPASGVVRVSRCNDRAVPRGHSGARHRCCRVELRRFAPPDSPSSGRGDLGCCVGGWPASQRRVSLLSRVEGGVRSRARLSPALLADRVPWVLCSVAWFMFRLGGPFLVVRGLVARGSRLVAQGTRLILVLSRPGTSRHGTARPGTAWHNSAWHGTAQHSTAQHSTARHGPARHGTARHGMARHSTARPVRATHGTARHSTAQHGTARHGAA
jgi:hypothetical protein